jgi:hypothetical protein
MAEKNEEQRAAPAQEVVLVDPHQVPVQYVDWIVTGGPGPAPGTLNVDLAAIDYAYTRDGRPQAILQARLRMSLSTAANLHRFLGELLTAATPQPQSMSLN